MALARLYHRRQYIYRLPVKPFGYGFQYLVLAHALHFLAAFVGVSFAGARIKEAHKVVYLGYSAHGRPRVFTGGFLLNGNNWAKARNLINIGPLHATHKLARVG